MNKILIVEDDESISKLIKITLTKSGYICKNVYDGKTASDIIESEYFDLVLLDIMIPEIDGFSLLPYIKEFDIPVIFITAKSSVEDKIKGLKMGADDYIVKPFDLMELNARVEAVLRRCHKKDRYLKINSIVIDTDSHIVTDNGKTVDLTLKEYELLLFFLRNKGRALYRETIYEHVWKEPYFGNTRTIDLHIQRLRKKLNLNIQSVYKIGYRLEIQEN